MQRAPTKPNPCTSYQSPHTDPGAFALIGSEHVHGLAHVLTTTRTATAAAGLIAVTSSELVALALLVRAGTSLDFHLTVTMSLSSSRMGETPAGRGEFRVLENVDVDLMGRAEDLWCAVRFKRMVVVRD